MTSLLAKHIGKKILRESVKNNFGTEDPYFEQVPATRLDGRPSSKTKKRRKALPAGVSEHDGKVLTKVKRRAYRLDMSLFNCCGIRFGWSSVIGIIPGIGDIIDAFMAIMVLRTCQQVEGGLPAEVTLKMYFNIIIDFGIGLMPVIGDIADAAWKANTRNAVVLEKYLRQKGAMALKAQGQAVPAIDPSDPDEYDRQMIEQHGPPPQYITNPPTRHGTLQHSGQVKLAQPPQAKVPAEKRGGGGWFGFGGRIRHADVESGDMSGMDQNPPSRFNLQKNRPGY